MSPDPAMLAATKFTAPRIPAAMVRRERLADRLRAGVERPLTLLAAPAGAGKSALLSEWAAERPAGTTAWLALDPADADRRRFWRGVLAALQRAGVGGPVASLRVHPEASVEVLLPALVNALDALAEPVVLVLDDLHEIGHSPAAADLDRLLRRPPEPLRIVVATRADPPLRVGRLRVEGELAEIRAAELAFTREETAALLRAAGVAVSPGIADLLWRRTEGWAAGLRLAALTMRTHPDPDRFVEEFAGDDSTVADYLLAEVLAQQPPELREFLLRIAIADSVSGELAEAITGRADAERLLARLERDHALLSSTGGARAWHRLHPLFAELLRSELRLRAPDEIGRLHRRAAIWFDAHDRPVEALRHAAAAGDWAHVGALAGAHWVPLLLEGELEALRPLLDRLPPELPAANPELALAVAGLHVSAGDEARARHWFEIASAHQDAVAPERRGEFDLGRAAVGLMRGRMRGDAAAAMRHARPLVERQGDLAVAAPGTDELRALAYAELGIAELWSGELEHARPHLETARGAALAAGRDWLVMLCVAYLGVDAMMGGRFERATRLCDEAAALARERGWSRTWPLGVVAGTLSSIAFHRDRLGEAEAFNDRAAELLHASADRPLRAMVAIQRARVLIARGRPEAGHEALQEAREWLRAWPIMPAITGLVTGLEATAMATFGDPAGAAALLERDGAGTEEAAVARARLHLQAGEHAQALERLTPLLATPGTPFRSTRIEACVVSALAHDALADHAAAGEALERALDGAEPGGLRRPFLAAGGSIGPLLRRHRRTGTGHRALLDDLLAALDQVGDARPVATLPESLSDREAAVLRFLPTMMSNQEIASELFVSVNTVKTHLKAIYRKLDVDDRRGAVRRARDLALLGPR